MSLSCHILRTVIMTRNQNLPVSLSLVKPYANVLSPHRVKPLFTQKPAFWPKAGAPFALVLTLSSQSQRCEVGPSQQGKLTVTI